MTMEGFVERFEGKLDAILDKVNDIKNAHTETKTVVSMHDKELESLRSQVRELKTIADRAKGMAIVAFAPGTISLILFALRAMQKMP